MDELIKQVLEKNKIVRYIPTFVKCLTDYKELLAQQDSIRVENRVGMQKPGIEFRPNIDEIDEIVTDNCRLHLEYMADDLIWMDIELPNGNEYHVNIYHKDDKCHKHLKTSGEKVG